MAPSRKPEVPVRYFWAVASRAIAAVGGGYGLSASVAAALSIFLPLAGMDRANAVMTATMLAFVAHAVAALWAFGCATALRAWLGIVLPAVVLGLPAWFFASRVAA
ncbi:DUF3649 domain-containing protein [Acidovorax cavernicola]|uniref:DUF3649 domain-containing protein n=2 Tax=Acidovorax cavernicola TaxID=1675792 RepID=A0A9X8GV77_9BURK|nr:DUF3649 domain-containing protein [Acidovorax cavernicola]